MIIFWDGFDFLSTSTNGRRWDASSGNSIQAGIYGNGKSLQGPSTKLKTLSTNYATIYFAFHWFTGTLSAHTIFGFEDAGSVQVDFRVDALGQILATRNGTTLGTSTARVSGSSWYWITGHVTINNSTGVAEIKIGTSFASLTTFLSLSSQNTRNSSNNFANQLFINSTATRDQQFDNLVLWDTTSSSGNDLTGDATGEIIIDTQFVSGAGNHAQWTPSTGSNFQNVDESPTSNDDTDYNSSTTSGQIDDFAVGNLVAATATIIAIAMNNTDRIDDASTHTVNHHLESVSAVFDGTPYTPGATFGVHSALVFLDPNTSAVPTVSARNSMKFGYKLAS